MSAAIYVLSFGIFAITTSEFMVSGMMPELASAFGVSVPAIGYLISIYAAGMVIGGPVLTVALLRLRKKSALLLVAGIFLAGQILASLAWTYPVMFVARGITGVAASAFFGVGIAIAVELVGKHARGRATALVIGGLMVGTVLGLPGATVLAQLAGWRASFWAVAALVAVAACTVLAVVPSTGRPATIDVRGELAAFRNSRLWAAYGTSALVIGAVFAAFSYFTPILIQATGFSAGTVPLLLAVYGAATVVGTIVVGRHADRFPLGIVTGGLAALTVVLTLFALFAENKVFTVVAILLLGLTGVCLNPALGVRVMRSANDGALVNTVHTAVINIGLTAGSSLGGAAIAAGLGITAPLWVGALIAVVGLLTILPVLLRSRRSQITTAAAPTHSTPTDVPTPSPATPNR